MIEKKIEEHRFEKAMEELRGKVPDSVRGKAGALGTDEEGNFKGFTEKELKKNIEHWEANPSYGVKKKDRETIRDTFEGHF